MRRRGPIYLVYQPRRNWRAWIAAGVGVATFVVGLTLSWPFLLCLVAGAGLGGITYAARL